MIPRSEYIAGNCSHDEYYSQFVTRSVFDIVKHRIGEEKITNSKDEHFNDIPLPHWDHLHDVIKQSIGHLIKLADSRGGISLTDTVCVAKCAARKVRGS